MKKFYAIWFCLIFACVAVFANDFSNTVETVINQFDDKESVEKFLNLAEDLFIFDEENGYYINNSILNDLVTLQSDVDVKDFCDILNKLFLIDEKCENFPKTVAIFDVYSKTENVNLSEIRNSLNAERNEKNKIKNLTKSKAKLKAVSTEVFPYTKQWNYHKNFELICQLFIFFNIIEMDETNEI